MPVRGYHGRPRAAVAAAAALLTATVGCSAGRANAPESGAARTRPSGLKVHRGAFEDRFLLTGQLAAVHAENLAVPRIPSWQTTIRWIEEEGTLVRAGQRVVELDTSSFAQDYSEKALGRDTAESDLEQAEADLAIQKGDKEFQLAQKTIAVDKAALNATIPAEFLRGKDYQENQMALRRAETERDKAKEDVDALVLSAAETIRQKKIALDKAVRELQAAREAMEGMVLTAPRDGILVVGNDPRQGRKFQVGDSVWVGLPVASIPDLAVMRVEAKLSDVDDGRIVPGLSARCVMDAYPDRVYTGKVADITPVAQEEAGRSLRRAYNVRIELDASDAERMRPGMSVKVEVVAPPRANVLLAPREGLEFDGPAPRARRASGDPVEVKLGPCNLDECVIEGGIDDGVALRSRG